LASQPTARYVAIPAARKLRAQLAAIAFSSSIFVSCQYGQIEHAAIVIAQFCKANVDVFFVWVYSFVFSPSVITDPGCNSLIEDNVRNSLISSGK
jgi:hypothetical protein